uniref:ORF4 n=1 Tax=Nasonia vitripennis virus TaxID=626355 RepID=C1K2N0_9VIRU|nr:ORF4 [Nasonia vitripennis virus]
MANTTVIKVHQRPIQSPELPGVLPRNQAIVELKTAEEQGALISEVGHPTPFKIADVDLMAFTLRKARKSKYPSHIYGNLEFGDAFSFWSPRVIDIPAEGSSIQIDPEWSTFHKSVLDFYACRSASAFYVIHVPLPLGASLYLEATCPEQTLETVTRGVRWRPNVLPSASFFVGWDYPKKWKLGYQKLQGGYTGLSLKLRTIQSSNSSSSQVPLKALVFCCMTDVRGMGLRGITTSDPDAFKFQPVASPRTWYTEMDSGETFVAQPGAIGDTPTAAVPETPGTKDTPVTAKTEEIVKVQSTPTQAVSSSKPNVKAVSQKFIFIERIKVSTADMGKPIVYQFKPSSRTVKGDDLGLPYRRNVWCTGVMRDGFNRECEFKITSTRSPQIAGIVQVRVIKSSDLGYSCRYHELGGQSTTVMAPPVVHEPSSLTERTVSTGWHKASQATYTLILNVLCINRTADSKEATLSIYARTPNVHFSVPTKPKKTPKPPPPPKPDKPLEDGTKDSVLQIAHLLQTIVPYGEEQMNENV